MKKVAYSSWFVHVVVFLFLMSSCNESISKQNENPPKEDRESGNVEISDDYSGLTEIKLEKLNPSNQKSPKRIFSLSQPSIGDVDIRLIWKFVDGSKKKLVFKNHGKFFELNEIYNNKFNKDINGIGTETYEELSIFSNEDYTVIVSSSPESASLIYWFCEVQFFVKSSSEPIFKQEYHAEDYELNNQ